MELMKDDDVFFMGWVTIEQPVTVLPEGPSPHHLNIPTRREENRSLITEAAIRSAIPLFNYFFFFIFKYCEFIH